MSTNPTPAPDERHDAPERHDQAQSAPAARQMPCHLNGFAIALPEDATNGERAIMAAILATHTTPAGERLPLARKTPDAPQFGPSPLRDIYPAFYAQHKAREYRAFASQHDAAAREPGNAQHAPELREKARQFRALADDQDKQALTLATEGAPQYSALDQMLKNACRLVEDEQLPDGRRRRVYRASEPEPHQWDTPAQAVPYRIAASHWRNSMKPQRIEFADAMQAPGEKFAQRLRLEFEQRATRDARETTGNSENAEYPEIGIALGNPEAARAQARDLLARCGQAGPFWRFLASLARKKYPDLAREPYPPSES